MATIDLLQSVLPPEGEGYYCIVGLVQGEARPKQTFHQTLADVTTKIDELLQAKYDVYFACAKYVDQPTGLAELKKFCKAIRMPLPCVVNSGRGIHAYWLLDRTISRAEWKPVAERLKALCDEHGFLGDPSRTADNASILRVPETFNFKEDPPLPVEILAMAEELDLSLIHI